MPEIGEMEKKNNPKKRYQCGRCEYGASRVGHLKRHISGFHLKIRNFKCEQCEYAASLAGDLKRHAMAVHDKVKSFKCDRCVYAAGNQLFSSTVIGHNQPRGSAVS